MREILFRGKTYNDKWVQGLLVQMDNRLTQIRKLGSDGIGYYDYSIVPSTVGQYTGLTDKNGKKIFENDICRYDNGEEFKDKDRFSNYVVQWDSVNTRYVVVDEWNCEDILDEFFSRHAVVIGNIHDNPELLEVTE